MADTREKLVELLMDTRANAAWHHWGYEESADHLIANGVTVQEWIPASEPPTESGEYLAYCGEYDGICVLYYEVLKTKGRWRTNWKNVTHWRPLPPAPKGE